MDFHSRFNQLLEERKVSTYKISQDTDLGQSLLGYWRRGEKSPTLENAIKLADYFDVSLDYLVGRSDEPK